MKNLGKVFDQQHYQRLIERGFDGGVGGFVVHPDATDRRRALDRYIGVADHYGGLTQDRIARLRSIDWGPFYQAYSELMVAYFMVAAFEYHLRFDPPGRRQHVGDVELVDHRPPVFIEVKAPTEPPPVDGKVYAVRNTRIIRQQLREAYDGLPDDRPTVVVVVTGGLRLTPFYDGEGTSGPAEACYGPRVIMVPINPPTGELHSGVIRRGFFQPERNRRASALAILEEREWDPPRFKFRVYHHPHATRPIPPVRFAGRGVRQFTFDHDARRVVELGGR